MVYYRRRRLRMNRRRRRRTPRSGRSYTRGRRSLPYRSNALVQSWRAPRNFGLPDKMKVSLRGTYNYDVVEGTSAGGNFFRFLVALGGTSTFMPTYRMYNQLADLYSYVVFGGTVGTVHLAHNTDRATTCILYHSRSNDVSTLGSTTATNLLSRHGSQMVTFNQNDDKSIKFSHSPQKLRGRQIEWSDDKCDSQAATGPLVGSNTYVKLAMGWAVDSQGSASFVASARFALTTTIYFQRIRAVPT